VEQPKQPHSVRLVALIEKLGAALEPEDAQLLIEAAHTAHRLESGQGFTAKPVVSMRTHQPLVDCAWMGMLAQVTTEQARKIGLGLIRTASEAETDGAVLKFFKDTGITDDRAAAAVSLIRDLREQFDSIIGEKQEPGDSLSNVVPFGGKPS
jgi:hypothetical protein